MIIDEPHKFVQVNKTWENIERIKAQLTFRYGATFPEKEVKYQDGLGVRSVKKLRIITTLFIHLYQIQKTTIL
ncbi:hypothetical protein BSPWISOXPB_1818 [uncultured Gammaproteobacteria bacterium]|nr:hypothetical protein BSPWISOXPB_1818 [uncultured Gammaproteobacteria bacterium]